MGGSVVLKVKATLEKQQESLAMDYSLVQSSLKEVLARLRTVDQMNDLSPPNHPNSGWARNVTWLNPTRSDCGGDQVGFPGAQNNKEPCNDVRPTRDGNSGMNVDPRGGSTNDVDPVPSNDIDLREYTSPP